MGDLVVGREVWILGEVVSFDLLGNVPTVFYRLSFFFPVTRSQVV